MGVSNPKISISYPKKTPDLAEFIGILIGDGSVSQTNYSIDISLNSDVDSLYIEYVKALIYQLFEVIPKQIKVKGRKLIKLRINSVLLFRFLKDLGIPVGEGEKFIPNWILIKGVLVRSFLRGLFDTDGSLFLSSRRSILNISISNRRLMNQVRLCLLKLDIEFSIIKDNINLSSIKRMRKFLELIGTSNTKNVIKFVEYMKNSKTIRSLDLPQYLIKYRDIKLPFKGVVV